MTWLLLRLHRTTLLLAAATTTVSVAVLVAYRLLLTGALAGAGVPQHCITEPAPQCHGLAMGILAGPAGEGLLSTLAAFRGYGHAALILLPLVLGLLTGAGTIGRELGGDAHLLTLTQHVGRVRWWAARLALAGGVAATGSVLTGAVGGWALAPLEGLTGPPQPLATPMFETSGLVPAGHALLACALGAVLVLLTRSAALAAFVTTVAYWIALFALASTAVRGAYLPPVPMTWDAYGVDASQPGENDWVVEQHYVDDAGEPVPDSVIYPDGDCGTLDDCMRAAGVVAVAAEVQPASRYRAFQLVETGILIVLAACAVAGGSVRLRRSLVR